MGSFRDRHGVVLPIALIALISLTGLLLVLLSLGSTESLIASSHTESTGALFVAEGGIGWAFDVLANTPNWNTALLGPDGAPNTADDGKLATSMPLSGLPASQGTFWVTVRNDTLASDRLITGVAPDPGGPLDDTNARLIVTSVGVKGNATRTIQVSVRRISLPPMVAALALPGNEAETGFTGNSFLINGNDTNVDDTPGGGSPVWGIAVGAANPGNEFVVEDSLRGSQPNNVLGKKQNPGGSASGTNTVSPDPQLTPTAIADFITEAKKNADLTLVSTQANPLFFTNVGATCDTNPASQTCWGTRSNPKLVYIKSEPDPTSAFSALQLSGGTAGAGVLIVEDGDLRISGNFRWDGIIIVTGQYVGVSFLGGGFQSVYGAVISNETARDPGYREGVLTGNAKLNYSSQAIDLARQMRRLMALSSWREM